MLLLIKQSLDLLHSWCTDEYSIPFTHNSVIQLPSGREIRIFLTDPSRIFVVYEKGVQDHYDIAVLDHDNDPTTQAIS
jgi:hypothetical protein